MDIDQLRRLMRESRTVSGAHLAVDDARWEEFLAKVKDSPRIGSITTTRAARENYDKMMGEMMGISQAIFFFFAVVVAFGVIYNGARIALSERTRDLATLRVLGFTQHEVAVRPDRRTGPAHPAGAFARPFHRQPADERYS